MVKWHTLDEFDFGTGDILLLMKADPKKKVWRREQGLQPEGKDYKVRDEVVTKGSYTEKEVKRNWVSGDKIWEQGHFNPEMHDPHPVKKEGDKIWVWYLSRTAWSNVVAWMWKKDLIEDFLKNSQ